jgi:hypothetical protein
MSDRINSSSRKASTFATYLVAGRASIPAGLVYAALVVYKWDKWWTVVPTVVVGLVAALLAIRRSQARVQTIAHHEIYIIDGMTLQAGVSVIVSFDGMNEGRSFENPQINSAGVSNPGVLTTV